MTLILTHTSSCYALMVTDRRLNRNRAVVDAHANKNIVFGDRNAVVAIGCTGMAYIGGIPTDQWLAQTFTGVTFPEGRRGRGSVPSVMVTHFEDQYLGQRVRNLMTRLNAVRPLVPDNQRRDWNTYPFELVITGWEWNHGDPRPHFQCLSKPRNSDTFEPSASDRHWHVPRNNRLPVLMCAAPDGNVTREELRSIQNRLNSVWRDSHGTPMLVADHAETLLAETVQKVSAREPTVGQDVMSILIPPPGQPDPAIRIRYISEGRNERVLASSGAQTQTPRAFSPWVISSGCIRAPSEFIGNWVNWTCGPYRVVMEGPRVDGNPGAMSGQRRPINP